VYNVLALHIDRLETSAETETVSISISIAFCACQGAFVRTQYGDVARHEALLKCNYIKAQNPLAWKYLVKFLHLKSPLLFAKNPGNPPLQPGCGSTFTLTKKMPIPFLKASRLILISPNSHQLKIRIFSRNLISKILSDPASFRNEIVFGKNGKNSG